MAADPDFRPWNELIPDALGLIFSKLNGQEVLGAIPLVCKPWCQVVEGPCWLQRNDTRHFLNDTVGLRKKAKVEKVLRALLPRSSGSLRELYVSMIDDHMLSFIAEHAGSLETLDIGIRDFKESTFEQFATELGTLTTLVVRSGMSKCLLEAIGKNCKRLVSFSWDHSRISGLLDGGNYSLDKYLSFVWSMPNLKHLSLRNASVLGPWCILRLLSGSPELEWVEIGGQELDPRAVKEKYPNIVTLVLSNGPDYANEFDSSWEDLQYENAEDYA